MITHDSCHPPISPTNQFLRLLSLSWECSSCRGSPVQSCPVQSSPLYICFSFSSTHLVVAFFFLIFSPFFDNTLCTGLLLSSSRRAAASSYRA